MAGALALGLAGHAALTLAELQLRPNPTYGLTMRTSGQRAADRELAVAMARAERAGKPLDRVQVARARRALADKHRQAPVGAILVGAMLLAAIAGAARSAPAATPRPPSNRALVVVGAVALGAIGLVLAAGALGP